MSEPIWKGSTPRLLPELSSITSKFREFRVVLEPDKNEPEWWAGAPSVVCDAGGVFWMACRMRTADSPRGQRGYEIRILRSEDGLSFAKVHSIRREDVPIPGFERPALVIDPKTLLFKLYGCGPWKDGPWSIIKWADARTPSEFDPSSATVVIQPFEKSHPRDVVPIEYKDPFILHTGGKYHCYVIGYLRQNERIFHFTSDDGERWEAVGSPYEEVMNLAGWHNFFVRPSCVLPLGFGYLFVYEGSNAGWYDPVYNIATGLGFTFDLHHVIDLTPDSPFVISTTPNRFFSTFRYSHWLAVDDEVWVYAEVASENETNEVRLFRLSKA
jgi:hypothetical protein